MQNSFPFLFGAAWVFGVLLEVRSQSFVVQLSLDPGNQGARSEGSGGGDIERNPSQETLVNMTIGGRGFRCSLPDPLARVGEARNAAASYAVARRAAALVGERLQGEVTGTADAFDLRIDDRLDIAGLTLNYEELSSSTLGAGFRQRYADQETGAVAEVVCRCRAGKRKASSPRCALGDLVWLRTEEAREALAMVVAHNGTEIYVRWTDLGRPRNSFPLPWSKLRSLKDGRSCDEGDSVPIAFPASAKEEAAEKGARRFRLDIESVTCCSSKDLESSGEDSAGLLLSPLQNRCLYAQNGWWSYELCWPFHIRQLHFHTVAEQNAAILRRFEAAGDQPSTDGQQSLSFTEIAGATRAQVGSVGALLGSFASAPLSKRRSAAVSGRPGARLSRGNFSWPQALEDAVKLDSPMDLDLVLMQFVDASEEQVIELLQAAAEGSLAEVESRLQLPQDPDSTTANGSTALMQASYAGHVEVVSLLLDAGTDKNAADNEGFTALILASGACHAQVVSLLLDAGADKDAATHNGNTALMAASRAGHVEVASLLLDAGADQDLANKNDGWTALIVASTVGHAGVVGLLLDASADTNLACNNGSTALILASEKGHVGVVRLLLQAGADKDLANKNDGYTALIVASKVGHAGVVGLLLEAGADTNLACNNGSTALMLASDRGHVGVVRLLLHAGADKDLANKNDGYTALIVASFTGTGHAAVVKLLLQAGADTDLADINGRTALMMASRAGHVEVVSLLVDAAANKDLVDNNGRTALMTASEAGRARVVSLLLKTSAGKDLADNHGRTALMTASRADHVDVVSLLLDAGTDKNLADNHGLTALMVASEASADKDLTDNHGRTALMTASRAGHVKVVSLLLDAGADKDVADKHGYTALLCASHVEVVSLLTEHL
eukprot:s344_g6.t2